MGSVGSVMPQLNLPGGRPARLGSTLQAVAQEDLDYRGFRVLPDRVIQRRAAPGPRLETRSNVCYALSFVRCPLRFSV